MYFHDLLGRFAKPDMVPVVRKGADMLKMKASQMLLCGPPKPDMGDAEGL